MKEVDKVKQEKTKAVKLKKLYDGIEFVDSNITELKATITLYVILQNAKNLFVKKLKCDISEFVGIFHIADIHIRLTKRHDEYLNIFDKISRNAISSVS